ncbi:SDR family oxidoreductase [Methylorubrum rhodesianum]|uniref:SDR family oxidoreductase n=1 Tax=Methylorubrum rhodesianum TaxID=29427 RepID=A0ABU9Z8P6_9HYPH|nr:MULTISPECIES: SDR family oxidoreductase [Methylorubrum]MBB5765855.1 short-subunit dehydrogenase [Methylorubrum rhodesianum]MBI1692152.1 SDR family oxidoreductase [Methylorubrum sp. DB1722]MBK3403157.1 SDR family oxidoreductase [Methylorubrum rhodesianum]MBY0143872.1 SDR family oxidoreductase [Methylorubrum populi]
MKNLHEAVVVIAGASSGIGRAAALAFARAGAHVVVAARRRDLLEALAEECSRIGPAALAVPTDVTDPRAVEALARAAEDRFGRIDAWINNAGTGVFGPFQDAPLDLHHRTVEVNLFGAMNGAYAVLPRFLERQRGILVNMVSLGGWAPAPFAAAYTASKFGLRGFSASLRQELRRYPHIHVCAVFPAMVDTPGFVHGANVSGRTLDPGPMLYAPEEVAGTLVHVVRHPRDEIAVGWPARAAQAAYALAPGPTEHLMGLALNRTLDRARPAPRTHGSLRAPIRDGTTSDGGWRARKRLPSASTLSGFGVAVLAAGAALALGGLLGRRSERSGR